MDDMYSGVLKKSDASVCWHRSKVYPCFYASPPRSLLSVASPYFARVVGV